jgi:hypothetical protein
MAAEDFPVPTTDSGAASSFNIEEALGEQMGRDGSLGDHADLASLPSLGHVYQHRTNGAVEPSGSNPLASTFAQSPAASHSTTGPGVPPAVGVVDLTGPAFDMPGPSLIDLTGPAHDLPRPPLYRLNGPGS